MVVPADSAGVPFAGRTFEPNPSAADDGSADPRLLDSLERFRAGELGMAEVIAAVIPARLLVPLVAERGDEGVGEHGQLVDKTQELSVVTVAGPDGRAALPAFTSVAALTAWDPAARPIPIEARRVALAAAGEGTELVILDPTSATEFGIRRTALRAIALDEPWLPCWEDETVLAAFRSSIADERSVNAAGLAPGDPDARLAAPELQVRLSLAAGLDREGLDALLTRLQRGWAEDLVIRERVDSIAVKVTTTTV